MWIIPNCQCWPPYKNKANTHFISKDQENLPKLTGDQLVSLFQKILLHSLDPRYCTKSRTQWLITAQRIFQHLSKYYAIHRRNSRGLFLNWAKATGDTGQSTKCPKWTWCFLCQTCHAVWKEFCSWFQKNELLPEKTVLTWQTLHTSMNKCLLDCNKMQGM